MKKKRYWLRSGAIFGSIYIGLWILLNIYWWLSGIAKSDPTGGKGLGQAIFNLVAGPAGLIIVLIVAMIAGFIYGKTGNRKQVDTTMN
jgi:hypothetical protein